MTDQRVMSPAVMQGRAAAPMAGRSTPPPAEPEEPRRRGRGVIVVALVLLAAAAVAAFLFLRGTPEDTGPTEPEPGAVVSVEPISVNLSDGHYLRLGFSMQLTADAHGEVQAARALDIAIATFSGRTMDEVNDPARREELKTELVDQLAEAFDGEVMDVYLTDFVTQ